MSLTKAKAEKSRVHAKQRRTEEAKEIAEIAELLPLPSHVTRKLDKASILRLAITFLRLKQYVGEGKNGYRVSWIGCVNNIPTILFSYALAFPVMIDKILYAVVDWVCLVIQNDALWDTNKMVELLERHIYTGILKKSDSFNQHPYNSKFCVTR